MILAFDWGAFWLGAVVSPVVIVVMILIYLTITDEELAKSRAINREMERRSKAVKQSLTEEVRKRMKEEK